ncbi:MAG: MFS transporter [Deltaproteobacteria bacterium]
MESSLPKEIKDSLNASWKEGVITQVMIGILDYYLTPFALFLNANTQQIGFLTAIPNLLSSVSQLFVMFGVKVLGSRLKLIKIGVGTQAVLLIPVALLALLPVPAKVPILIALVAIYRILGSQIGPAWGSLVSDYLAPEQRGRYFGWRQRAVGLAGILGVSFWGLMLYLFKNMTSMAWSFAMLFSAAFIFRFISYRFIAQMHDLPMHHETTASKISFLTFFARFRESNFAKFIFYVTSMTFATQLCAPFFSVHMLRDLHFSYLSYMAVNLASVCASLIAWPIWGRHADVVGNAKVLKETGLLIPVIPILWMFATTPWQLVAVEFLSGLLFSGFTLSTTNFIYDSCSSSRRVFCLIYYNLLNGVSLFFAASLGGFLSSHLYPLLGYPLVTLFLISAILRLCSNLFLSRHFEEVRISHKKVSSLQLYLSVLGIDPIVGKGPDPSMESEP